MLMLPSGQFRRTGGWVNVLVMNNIHVHVCRCYIHYIHNFLKPSDPIDEEAQEQFEEMSDLGSGHDDSTLYDSANYIYKTIRTFSVSVMSLLSGWKNLNCLSIKLLLTQFDGTRFLELNLIKVRKYNESPRKYLGWCSF